MKARVFLLSVITIVTVSFLVSSCVSEEDKRPKIVVVKKTATGKPGETVSFNVKITSRYKIENISITPEVLGENDRVNLPQKKKVKSKSLTYSYTIPENTKKERIQITFKVKNKKRTSFAYAFVNIDKHSETVQSYNSVKLGSYSDLDIGSFFNVSENSSKLILDAKSNSENIDLVFFKGRLNGYTISAPNDNLAKSVYHNHKGMKTWKNQNRTKFAKTSISASEFDSMTNANSIKNVTSKATFSHVNHLSNGSVIAFVTESGTHGIAKITTFANSSKIAIQVKVVKNS